MIARRIPSIALALALFLLIASPVLAKKNDPNIRLAYTPTTSVGEASAVIPSDMRRTPVRLRVVDGRGSDDPTIIGVRTDDDDREFDLLATSDVIAHTLESLLEQSRRWQVQVTDDAGLELVCELLRFQIQENNQAVGASYTAEVQLGLELRDDGGRALHSISASGDASRYGKKFSEDNTNEVLSDALAEAFASGLNDRALQTAWIDDDSSPVATSAPASPRSTTRETSSSSAMDPETLLAEMQRLMGEGLEAETLSQFVAGKTLSRAFSADDLSAWKAASVPESVLRAAMGLPIQ